MNHNIMSRSRPVAARHGTILIVTMVIVFALASIVLVMCRTARVEAAASANVAANAQASAIASGAEQFVLALLASEGAGVLALPQEEFEAVPLGEGYFWVVRPNYEDDTMPLFGLVDENSKLDVNTASVDAMMYLPGMTEDVAAAIKDWRDEDLGPEPSGAEAAEYAAFDYTPKNLPFETMEELLMVLGVTREMLFGDGTAGPLGQPSSFRSGGLGTPDFNDPMIARGLYDLLTVYSLSTQQGQQGQNQNVRGRINLNTAPRQVLLCLGLPEADVDKLLSARPAFEEGTTDTAWAQAALGPAWGSVQNRVTGQSMRYSADILAVSGNGRAFKRVRMVADVSDQTSPRVLYRRDITDRGWPLDEQILTSLRERQGSGIAGSMGSIGLGTAGRGVIR